MSTPSRRRAPKMWEVRDFVEDCPGCPILPAAEAVGPNGSRKFGYRTVHRAVRAGLIRAELRPNGRYALYPTETKAAPVGT